MTIGLNINGSSHSKKTSLTRQNKNEDCLVQKLGLRRPQTSFRQSFLFSSSANEALLAGCGEPTILDKRPGESHAILNFVIPVISGCRKSPLATFDLKKPHNSRF